jgi:hypothetical protein
MGVNYHDILNLEKVGFDYFGNLLLYLFYNIGPWCHIGKRSNEPLKTCQVGNDKNIEIFLNKGITFEVYN